MSRPLAVILADLSAAMAEGSITSALVPSTVKASALLIAEALGAIQLTIEGIDAADAGELRAAVAEARADLAELAPAVSALTGQVEALRASLADARGRLDALRAEVAAAVAGPVEG